MWGRAWKKFIFHTGDFIYAYTLHNYTFSEASLKHSDPQYLVDKWISMVDNFLVLLGERSSPLVGAANVGERR